ncbi:TOBE domain-containing protein [Pelodictyon luteolum]|uniref:Mop domain-containing protein n=1 Tax=Chlorobium luteolum (strain DSM 273 / BCRC 81028 / 2530) TaxID=319225 RepID=Q3B266_CHLL3|nr:TOBE domain-containing protein [Pelodictyon luteolum]ABB24565.1 hypothetical protein Plut_1711 [Pelodictyon luteolum DSM 273]
MNSIQAVITTIEKSGPLCFLELDAGGTMLAMLLFELKPAFVPGRSVRILFKETEVALAKGPALDISIANRFGATITAIERGAMLADLTLETPMGTIGSITTIRAIERLSLQVGDGITALVKATALSLESTGADSMERDEEGR